MRRSFLTLLPCIVMLMAHELRGNDPPMDSWSIPQLIAALADADGAVRKEAGFRLIDIGAPARPELLKAARSDSPELRAQATKILRKMPWSTADDPADARQLLETYGESPDSARAGVISRLAQLKATPTLLRLLAEEPSDLVRWVIVQALFESRDADTTAALRALEPAADDAPASLLAARVWVERDPPRGRKLLRQAIDADAARPSNDALVLLSFAFEHLIQAAIESHDFTEAAELLRRQIPRELAPRRSSRWGRQMVSASLARLLALHEYVGPMRGFAWDCQTWQVGVGVRPRLREALTLQLAWLGFTPPLPMQLTAALSMRERYEAGTFLAAGELTVASELELDAAAGMLEQLLKQRNRGRRAIDLIDESGDMLAELHWRRIRRAQNAGDPAAVDREIQLLMDLGPSNTDVAIKIVVWLKENKRPKEAKSLFDRVYDQGREDIERRTTKAGARNDLAWLCARSGERLDEAVELAQQAVDEMPDTAAFLDTLAEAKYRTGKRDEAIKLEERALELAPGTKFMKEQLERFKAGK